MTNRNKAKGNRLERSFIKECERQGLAAKRAWASDGRALGQDPEVDCMLMNYKVQCKCGYNQPSVKLKEFLTNVDFCYWSAADKRKNPDADYVFMTLETFFSLMVLLKVEYEKDPLSSYDKWKLS